MTEPNERREIELQVGKQVAQLEGKIERVGDQVHRLGEETRSALDLMMKQQTEQWKWYEKTTDMENRNLRQAIELLTTSTVKMQTDVGSLDTQVDMLAVDLKVSTATQIEQQKNGDLIHDELLRRIEALADTLKWVTRTFAATLMGGAITLFIYFVTR